MTKKYTYEHTRDGDNVTVTIRDGTYRKLHSQKFNIRDKNQIYSLLKALEKFGAPSIYALIQEKLKQGEWW